MRQFVGMAIKAIVILYLGLMLGLIFGQRNIVFVPSKPGNNTPAQYATPYQSVRLPSGDGVIDAWWVHEPENATRPNMLYCHGNGGSLSGLAHVAGIFYRYGWNALLFDYRGYGRSEQPSTAEITEERVVEDAESAYLWLRQQKPSERIFFWGHSLGSSICARLASKYSPAGLVIEGAFPSAYDMARYRYPWAVIAPFMLLDKFATEDYLSNAKFPILQIHAEADQIIPLHMGEELFRKLPGEKEFVLIPQIGHNDFPSVAESYHEKLTVVVKKWVGS